VLSIFMKIVRGVDHMHRKGVAHLDLKPGNVILSKDLQVVKVCDLGLSGNTTRQGAKELSGFHGTPGYIAPEVWRWRNEESHPDRYSTRADVWSLACILVDMMIPNERGGWSIAEEVRRIAGEDHSTPPKLDSGDQNWPAYTQYGEDGYQMVINMVVNLPRLMEDRIVLDVISNCLQPDPDKRWPSGFLAETLEQEFGERQSLLARVNTRNLCFAKYNSWAPGVPLPPVTQRSRTCMQGDSDEFRRSIT